MIRWRHLRHPVQSARGLHRRLNVLLRRSRLQRRTLDVRRGQRDACWCGGTLRRFKWHRGYGVCADCGCYVNRYPPLPHELQRIYSFDFYWHTWQTLKGHLTIENRTANDKADGRLDYWLGLIRRYGPPAGRVIEIGCAHGILLAELANRGYQCVGLEVDAKTAAWTRETTGLDIRSGLFPGLELPRCDLFLAFDVIEHSLSPVNFLQEAAKLLVPGGVAVLQTPIEYQHHKPPFGDMYEKTFDQNEHMYLFTPESMRRLAERTGFVLLAEEQWRIGHEVVVLGR